MAVIIMLSVFTVNALAGPDILVMGRVVDRVSILVMRRAVDRAGILVMDRAVDRMSILVMGEL